MGGLRLGKNKWVLLLVVVLLLQTAGMAFLGAKYHSLATGRSAQSSSNNTQASLRLFSSDIQSAFAKERVVVSPTDSLVYIPEFRIKIPYDDVSKSLAYTMRGYIPAYASSNKSWNTNTTTPEADFTSTYYTPPVERTVKDCGGFSMVRIKQEDKPKPYNPHEKPYSLKLADGRNIQIYQLINEKECNQSWYSSISPVAVAATLLKAQSY